jgi:hypothetical protein
MGEGRLGQSLASLTPTKKQCSAAICCLRTNFSGLRYQWSLTINPTRLPSGRHPRRMRPVGRLPRRPAESEFL